MIPDDESRHNEVPRDASYTPAGVAMEERFTGYVLLLECLPSDALTAWKEFLEVYSGAIRSRSVGDRMLVCAGFSGSAMPLPRGEVAVEVLRWDDCISEIDAAVYAAQALRNRTTSSRKRFLLTTCIAKLALWDFELGRAMCDWEPHALMQPRERLADWGRQQGWQTHAEPCWNAGSAWTLDGEMTPHSGYLALHDRRHSIDGFGARRPRFSSRG